MEQNGYMEPRNSMGSVSQSPLGSPPQFPNIPSPAAVPGQQINGGFVQSPINHNKPAVGTELETSFSDDLSISPQSRGGQLKHPQSNNNGSVPNMLPLNSPHTAVNGSTSPQQSPLTPANTYTNDTVQIPLQYYQHLHQIASMVLPALNNQQQTPAVTTPLTPSSPGIAQLPVTNDSSAEVAQRRPKLPNPRVPITSAGRQEVTNSQIYDEIPAYKMYADLPKLPLPPTQDGTTHSSESLLPHNASANHQRTNNPLYGDTQILVDSSDTGSPATQRDSSSLYSTKSQSHMGRCCVGVRCLCVAVLLLTIVSCTALIITLLTASRIIIFHDGSPAEAPALPNSAAAVTGREGAPAYLTAQNDTRAELVDLQERISELRAMVDSLSESSIGQEQNIKNLTSLIPTGGINPKLCSYDFAGNSRSAGQDLYNLYTNYAPSYDLTPSLQNQIVIAASCTSVNFKDTALQREKYANTEDIYQYRCYCHNLIEDGSDKGASCTIHFWTCPVVS